MLTVTNNEHTIIIKNSKFICQIYHINTQEEIKDYLDKAKQKYKDATHYCYAYILNNTSKYQDDGEPSKTAGFPILEVLKHNNLNNVLCIVIRYFGKILLGANGLIRAYTKSTTECLKNHIVKLTEGYNISITFDYPNIKKIDYLLKNIPILEKEFSKQITYTLNLTQNQLNQLKQSNLCIIKINKNIYL